MTQLTYHSVQDVLEKAKPVSILAISNEKDLDFVESTPHRDVPRAGTLYQTRKTRKEWLAACCRNL